MRVPLLWLTTFTTVSLGVMTVGRRASDKTRRIDLPGEIVESVDGVAGVLNVEVSFPGARAAVEVSFPALSTMMSRDYLEWIGKVAGNMALSIQALGPTMSAFPGETSPQLARAIQATENIWKRIESEFGMFSGTEVARMVGSSRSGRSLAAEQRKAGKIIGIKRGNAFAYPGFQFDEATGKVLEVIPRLLETAREVEWDEEDLVLWLVSPSRSFGDDRPVDHLDDEDLLTKLHGNATAEW